MGTLGVTSLDGHVSRLVGKRERKLSSMELI